VIVGPLGEGGMGQVYRARDNALRRDVAIKVLTGAFVRDEERLRRFAQEAQATAALNHPNILAIYQIGQHESAPFIVSELLNGSTLREQLQEGALPVRKAVDYAAQVARGLAAAHEKGIVHRDLKPENIFITDDGRAKILDFGIAKLEAPDRDAQVTQGPTVSANTGSGTVLGTIGYMSPEQARGQTLDSRTDIFSLGATLYEMLSGRRAFKKDTAADTISAILREDPPDLQTGDHTLPPALERIVKRCLEKNPSERFQSARDLAFALENGSTIATGPLAATREPRRRTIGPIALTAAVALLLVAASSAVVWKTLGGRPAGQPTYQRVTFRRGAVLRARFAPTSTAVVYGAAWDGRAPETFVATADSPESRALGIPKSDIYAVSSTGELAISLRTGGPFPPRAGVLARAPLSGGAAPREVLDKVEYADWGPDGSIAVTLDTGVGDRLEYPLGTMLFEAPGALHQIRVSPDGQTVAFQEVSEGLDALSIVDKQKKKTTLASGWLSINGIAWRSNDELWFAGIRKDSGWALWGLKRTGQLRLILSMPGQASLEDVAADGQVLICRQTGQTGIRYAAAGTTEEADLSWLDRSSLNDLSVDGRQVLLTENGEAGGAEGAVYLRNTDGSPAVKLGTGSASALSPDGKWAITTSRSLLEMSLLPTGAGTPIRMKGTFARYAAGTARWTPDGKRIVFAAMEAKHEPRIYLQELSGDPRPISPEGVISGMVLSPDGRRLAAVINNKSYLITIGGDGSQTLTSLTADDVPLTWSADGQSIYVRTGDRIAAEISQVNLITGTRTPWKTLIPSDPAGVTSVRNLHISPDGRSYAYSYTRTLSELLLVSGLH
jgi:eukaryotic-like serine/threonine-protein kinase